MGQLGLLCKYLQWEKQAENGKAVGNPKGGNTATNIRPPKGIKGDNFIASGLVPKTKVTKGFESIQYLFENNFFQL